MKRPLIFFGQVMDKVSEIASAEKAHQPLVVRDLNGRISIALDKRRDGQEDLISRLEQRIKDLGAYAGSPAVICRDDLYDPDVVFKDPAIMDFATPGTGADTAMRVLERQITGRDWVIDGKQESPPLPRFVFFGLKGGVGRSTALAVLAYWLAKAGRKVLLIDLDLESPGLSGLLLPPDKLADFGVVDWLIEDAVGQGHEVVDRMISTSPLADSLSREIRVAAAIGRKDVYYLDKLSRAYADVPKQEAHELFGERIRKLIEILEKKEKPDVVLIDSRAGMHDLAALSVVGIPSTTAFLFAAGGEQAWQGYQSLFTHWRSRPQAAKAIRERLRMVSALFPETEQAARAQRFLQRSYNLFTETLYDAVEAGERVDMDLFSFDLEDTSAPHFPLRIKWNIRFQEFDPLAIPRGLFTDDEIRASFGEFLDGVIELGGFRENE